MFRRTKSVGNRRVKNATQCEYDGKKFKSKLEMFCYKELKLAKLDFTYEENTYELINSFYPAIPVYELDKKTRLLKPDLTKIRACTYTPDFVVKKNGKVFIIEVKGMEQDAFKLKWKMFRQYIQNFSTCDALFLVKNQKQVKECIEIIKLNESL